MEVVVVAAVVRVEAASATESTEARKGGEEANVACLTGRLEAQMGTAARGWAAAEAVAWVGAEPAAEEEAEVDLGVAAAGAGDKVGPAAMVEGPLERLMAGVVDSWAEGMRVVAGQVEGMQVEVLWAAAAQVVVGMAAGERAVAELAEFVEAGGGGLE